MREKLKTTDRGKGGEEKEEMRPMTGRGTINERTSRPCPRLNLSNQKQQKGEEGGEVVIGRVTR